jgi:uncharacterized protein involved in exopolysaccharide biosynthesis
MHATLARTPDRSQAIDNEFILRELLLDLWRSRWAVVAICALFVISAIVASRLLPKKYEAVLLLSPAVGQSSAGGLGALSSAVSQLGGIASLAGLSVGANSGVKAESLATLESETLTERYIQNNNLLPILYYSKWDAQRRQWKSTEPGSIPTLWKGNRYFKGSVRTVVENPRTGLVTLTITWTDAKLAADWANGLVKMTNDYLREKAINESQRNIDYLSEQLAKTSVVEVRNSIYLLMESEIKKQMLARGNQEYALKVIDPAVPPEKAVSPRPILWPLAAFCVGMLLSLIYVFIRFIAGSDRKQQDALTSP